MATGKDSMSDASSVLFKHRFRGFLPVVVDLETGGFNASTDGILEIAATFFELDDTGQLSVSHTIARNVDPFEGANLEPSALEFTGIDPENPLREAVPEEIALGDIFGEVRREVKDKGCNRAILVGHNAHFDAGFLNAATERCQIKRNPFHPFSYFDTSTLAGLAYGHTVLAQACKRAGIEFSNSEAHSADYDAQKTAELFAGIVNRWQALGGWAWPEADSIDEE
jgi:ribonuclease T